MATKFYGYKNTEQNLKPIASLAYTEITAVIGSIIQLDARRSKDPEGNELTFKWSFQQVPIGSGLTDSSFRNLRVDRSAVSFTPDKTGLYVVLLVVNDGELDSDPVTATVDVQISKVPIGEGITPDAQFLWAYFSDFWNLVEDRAAITAIWSAVIQDLGAEYQTLWSNDSDKSIATIQERVQRRWQKISMITDLTGIRQTVLAVNKMTGKATGDTGVSGNLGEAVTPGYTAVFHAPYGDLTGGTADFERLNRDYGAKGRILVVNNEGYTIDRAYKAINPADSTERSVIVIDETVIPNGLVGARWRIPHLLYVPDVDLEADGVRAGDIILFEVTRSDVGTVADLRAQVVGVDRNRVGFEWSLDTLEIGGPSTDRDLFKQVIQDLRILPYDASESEISGAAKAIMQFMPIGVNLATRPFSPFYLTIKAKKILHNSVAVEDERIVAAPALQEKIYQPDSILRENLDYVVETGKFTFVSGLFTLSDPAPEVLWAECCYIDNTETIEHNFGLLAELKHDDLTASQTRAPYLSAVKGLFYCLTNGPTMFNIRLGIQILLGLPFAESRGRILERDDSYSYDSHDTEIGRLLIEDLDDRGALTGYRRLYYYPTVVGVETNPVTGQEYKVGDTVYQWAPLCKGVEVTDYVKDPNWWRGSLGGIEVLKYFTFKFAIDSEVFDMNDVQFAYDFVKKIKPVYTKVIAAAIRNLSDDITVEDSWASTSLDLNFYDNAWGFEATCRVDDYSTKGTARWGTGSKPLMTRNLVGLRDIETFARSGQVIVRSATGWDTASIRGRIVEGDVYTDSPMVEGDLLVIFRGQAGAGVLTDGVYEIDEVIDGNEVSLLSVASLGDRSTLYYVALSTSLFRYGTSLHGCIMRRCSNPVVLGDDLATSVANNTVTSATVKFKTNGVGVDDHLVIESGADAGEYRIDVVTTSPLNISETQVKLKNLDGTVPTFSTATGLAFRVIRPLLVPTMVYDGISEYNGTSSKMEVAAYDPGYFGSSDVYRDCFSPSMVGSLISITGSQNTANNGTFRITKYINPGRVETDSASTTSDTGIQAIARVQNIWHPCDGRLEELVPWDLATFELHGVP